MKKQLLSAFILSVLVISAFAQTKVQYHTNKFTSQYGTSGMVPSTDFSKIVTRFTPTIAYPCKLVKMKAWFRNSLNPSKFNWVVYLDPTGAAAGPGNTPFYLSTTNNINPAAGGVADSAYVDSVDLTSKNIVLTSGDVYAGVTEHFQTNPFIGITQDVTNTSTADRHWVYSGAWYQAVNWVFANASWGITAYFSPTTATYVDEVPALFNAVEVFPQPASSEATLNYLLSENATVSISLLNAVGEAVDMKVINAEDQPAGEYSVQFPVSQLAGGIYFIRLEANNTAVMKKLVVVK